MTFVWHILKYSTGLWVQNIFTKYYTFGCEFRIYFAKYYTSYISDSQGIVVSIFWFSICSEHRYTNKKDEEEETSDWFLSHITSQRSICEHRTEELTIFCSISDHLFRRATFSISTRASITKTQWLSSFLLKFWYSKYHLLTWITSTSSITASVNCFWSNLKSNEASSSKRW